MSEMGFIYHGYVRHRRFIPKPHYFKYRIQLLFIKLGRQGALPNRFPFFSERWPSLGWLRRKDYLGDAKQPLVETIYEVVKKELGFRPDGEVYLLTQLRYWGLVMNPICIFYCYNKEKQLVASVLQVTNTPWKERIMYVLDVTNEERQQQSNSAIRNIRFDKNMHVSPFNYMDMEYHCRMGEPGRGLFFHLENHDRQQKHTDATLCLHRKTLTESSLMGIVLMTPFHSLKVLLGIYSNALKLWLKRIPVYDHQAVSQPPKLSSAQTTRLRKS